MPSFSYNFHNSFTKIYTLAQYLALTPPFNFKRKELQNLTILRWCYAIFLLLFSTISVLVSYVFLNDVLNYFEDMTEFRMVLFFLSDVLAISLTIISILTALRKQDEWSKLLNGCIYFNKNYKQDGDIDTLYFIFTIGNILYAMRMFWELYVAICESTYVHFAAIQLISYHYYMTYVITVIMFNCLFSFNNGYHYVNKLIKQLRKQQVTISNSEGNNMRYIYLMYTIVNERVANYNEIFGWQLFFMFAYSPTLLLSGLVSVTVLPKTELHSIILTCFIDVLAMVLKM